MVGDLTWVLTWKWSKSTAYPPSVAPEETGTASLPSPAPPTERLITKNKAVSEQE